MDHEIQFGEVAESSPQPELRPDRNPHWAVVPCGKPADAELALYVDLDVMQEMESHALADTSVELGGVLLGGQHVDGDGRPFVVVTDSLRARHFEATRGSFKFTHDTWSEISRQRESFPPGTQIIGWYHTHPDWGVFLSGMDMFICDNFFNKPLDVALVIDPCRGDRGWFQWTGDAEQRIRRLQGFHLMASRFRQRELEAFAAQEEGPLMPQNLSGNHPGYSAPVVNIAGDRAQGQGVAVLGMLVIQFCFLAIVSWKLLTPAAPDLAKSEQLTAVEGRIDHWLRDTQATTRNKAQSDLLDRVITQLGHAPPGTLQELTAKQDENERLFFELRGQRALVEQLDRTNLEIATRSAERQQKLEDKVDALVRQQDLLKSRYETQAEQLAKTTAERDALRPQGTDGEGVAGGAPWWRIRSYWVVSGGVAALAGVAWLVWKHQSAGGSAQSSRDLSEPMTVDRAGES